MLNNRQRQNPALVELRKRDIEVPRLFCSEGAQVARVEDKETGYLDFPPVPEIKRCEHCHTRPRYSLPQAGCIGPQAPANFDILCLRLKLRRAHAGSFARS